MDIADRYRQMRDWGIPSDAYNYILKNNLVPTIEKIAEETKLAHKFVGIFFGHTVKNIEGKARTHADFSYNKIYGLFKFIKTEKLDYSIAKDMLPLIFEHANLDFQSVLTILKFKKRKKEELVAPIEFLHEKFKEIKISDNDEVAVEWLMGQLHRQAIGNISLKELRKEIEKKLKSNS